MWPASAATLAKPEPAVEWWPSGGDKSSVRPACQKAVKPAAALPCDLRIACSPPPRCPSSRPLPGGCCRAQHQRRRHCPIVVPVHPLLLWSCPGMIRGSLFDVEVGTPAAPAAVLGTRRAGCPRIGACVVCIHAQSTGLPFPIPHTEVGVSSDHRAPYVCHCPSLSPDATTRFCSQTIYHRFQVLRSERADRVIVGRPHHDAPYSRRLKLVGFLSRSADFPPCRKAGSRPG